MVAIENIFFPQKEIADFCCRWQINELALFGSVLRDNFGPDSDLDVLVTFAPQADWSLFDHLRMEEELSHLFNREINLLSRQAVERSHNKLRRQEILNTAQVVYVSLATGHF
jgi:predicted nucleotidyltransferase